MDRVTQEAVCLRAVVQAETRGRKILDDLEHGNKRASGRANEQSCPQPSTIIRAKRRPDREGTCGTKPEQPARTPQVETKEPYVR